MTENIYLDHAATTPVHPDVAEALAAIYQKGPHGNPSSIHGAGRAAKKIVDQARQVIARSIGAKADEIIFTSGGTESDNTAIISAAEKMQDYGKHIISTKIEHAAVLEPLKYLENRGFDVTYIDVDQDGQIDLKLMEKAIRSDTILVSAMLVNNEVGSILPIAGIAELIKDRNILLHTDAVQAYGKIPIDVNELGVDYLSVSAHKINGPKGIGFLYERHGHDLKPYMHGGSQERERRGGTHNVPGSYGMQKAVELFAGHLGERQQYLQDLKNYFITELQKSGIDFQINGTLNDSAPHIVNIYFPGQKAEQALIRLDLEGVSVSTSSACSAGVAKPSHVLEAMYGSDSPRLNGSLRFSFGLGNTSEQIDAVVAKICQIMI